MYLVSLSYYYVVNPPGEPPHHFFPPIKKADAMTKSQRMRILGVRVSNLHLEQLFPSFPIHHGRFHLHGSRHASIAHGHNATIINLSINTELLILSGDNQSV